MTPEKRAEQLKDINDLISDMGNISQSIQSLVIAIHTEDANGEDCFSHYSVGTLNSVCGLITYLDTMARNKLTDLSSLDHQDWINRLK